MELKIKDGECDSCEYVGALTLRHHNMWLCEKCWKMDQAVVKIGEPIFVQSPLTPLHTRVHKIDQQAQIVQDIYNMKTASVNEIIASIEQDDTVAPDRKQYVGSEVLSRRLEHISSLLFDKKKEVIELENEQRALHVKLNQLANQLTDAERKQLKLQDINYNPSTKKVTKPASTPAPTTNMKELKVVAQKYGIAQNVLQIIAKSKNLSYEDAAKHFQGISAPSSAN